MTRAREELFLTYGGEPSRYISELDEELFEIVDSYEEDEGSYSAREEDNPIDDLPF